MTKKASRDPDQLDMFGIIRKRTGTMRTIRQERRDAAFTELSLWVPEEKKEELKRYAKQLIEQCGRPLPRSKD